jgi:hypothetical protein
LDPTDASGSGPGTNGLWWVEVGIYQGEWDTRQDINPNQNDVYKYFDPLSADFVYIKRTSVSGSGYRTETDAVIGSQDSRSLVLEDSGFNACSIDLDSTLFGFYQTSESQKIYTSTGLSGIPINSINEAFVNTYVKPSDFRSGLFIDSRWLSGYNVNYFQNVIRKRGIYNLDMSYDAPNTLKVRIQNKPFDVRFEKSGYDIKKDDYVWLNGVVYQNGGDTVNLSGRYTVSKNPTYVQVGSDNYIEYKKIENLIFKIMNDINVSENDFESLNNIYRNLNG